MTELRLAGLDLTDTSSRLLVRHTPQLTRLDLSHCLNVSDQTVRNLAVSPLRESLTHLNLAGRRGQRSSSSSSSLFVRLTVCVCVQAV